ncbi:MAG: hypothetical protein ACREVY_16090 [Gammaproteobacteria bacterium]
MKVERHRDHFPHDCADEDWLRIIGRRGWVAVSHDRRIRYKPNELAAVVRHRVTLLVVVGKAPFSQLARHFVTTGPRITKFLAKHTPPLIRQSLSTITRRARQESRCALHRHVVVSKAGQSVGSAIVLTP